MPDASHHVTHVTHTTNHQREPETEGALVGELLQDVGGDVVLVHDHVVVTGPRGTQESRVAGQVEVILKAVRHFRVNHRACQSQYMF